MPATADRLVIESGATFLLFLATADSGTSPPLSILAGPLSGPLPSPPLLIIFTGEKVK
ncbi:hypothetical protein [Virgisporangium ochraceum]|uniref:hypothetical protein n=1 Tax=Virgisporangium ochraceum TaxID=65505 RepID=UPI001940A9EA|nr:hypothetical protein [Virgisporangium ochraceum]